MLAHTLTYTCHRCETARIFLLLAGYLRLESEEDACGGLELRLLTQTKAQLNVPLCHGHKNHREMRRPGPPPQHIFMIISLICLIGLLPLRSSVR